MAQFNKFVCEKNNEVAKTECGMYLQACLSEQDYMKLKKDWKSIGGYKVIPLWQYAFENIDVNLKSK